MKQLTQKGLDAPRGAEPRITWTRPGCQPARSRQTGAQQDSTATRQQGSKTAKQQTAARRAAARQRSHAPGCRSSPAVSPGPPRRVDEAARLAVLAFAFPPRVHAAHTDSCRRPAARNRKGARATIAMANCLSQILSCGSWDMHALGQPTPHWAQSLSAGPVGAASTVGGELVICRPLRACACPRFLPSSSPPASHKPPYTRYHRLPQPAIQAACLALLACFS